MVVLALSGVKRTESELDEFGFCIISGVAEPETELYVFGYHHPSGPDGSRTRVQKPIPCPSTSVAYGFSFPPPDSHKHDSGFSSFMIRLYAQSLTYIVSCIVEA